MEQPQSTDPEPAVRLLPWTSPEGEPCCLLPGTGDGYLSRLADSAEARQLAVGADVLAVTRQVLDDPLSPHAELRYAGLRLAECPGAALRVAESRGMRLTGDGSHRGGA
ncbi:hypothetical protein [Streptomyces sp. JB150]|uniref:hypothetical protein n=1 Tax=Streptomyces sp. JB150 TaxID=2714844 RepID=UPI001407743F|nr:hypothetical protein [Streptomyces sp. JB150]QIJ63181.1 hypothetical protein G7Z13_14900 [Streptomyces sp. JB150]